MSKSVRRPRVDLDARGDVATHGLMTAVRGDWHDTESSDAAGIKDLEGIVNFWGEQNKGYGAHLIIDKDGNSALCANFNQITWHTEDRNTGMIGVELVGFARFSNALWWTRREQLDKLAKWIAYINRDFHVPISFNVNVGWSGHIDQTKAFHLPSGHTDPGKFFPKGYVLRKARIYRKEGWA